MPRKPDALEELHPRTEKVFRLIQVGFNGLSSVTFNLTDIDADAESLRDPEKIAGMTLRRLQALRYLASPQTETGVIVTVNALADLIPLLQNLVNYGPLSDSHRQIVHQFALDLGTVAETLIPLDRDESSDHPEILIRGSLLEPLDSDNPEKADAD